MGGSVTVIVRFSDGEVLSRETWTNRFAWKCKSIEFLKEDKDFIKNSFHKDDADIGYPSEYGITIFDFLKRKCLSFQGYSNPSKISFATCAYDNDDIKSFNILRENGIINRIACNYKNRKQEIILPSAVKTFNESILEIDLEFKKFILSIDSIKNIEDINKYDPYEIDRVYEEWKRKLNFTTSSDLFRGWYGIIDNNFEYITSCRSAERLRMALNYIIDNEIEISNDDKKLFNESIIEEEECENE